MSDYIMQEGGEEGKRLNQKKVKQQKIMTLIQYKQLSKK